MAALGGSGLAAALLVTATACLTSGCSTLGYYAQAVSGHLAIVRAARPVADWVADPATPPALKQRLELSQQMRDFAVQKVGLPDNASYRRYADLGRPAAVWNVVAAPELGLRLKTWCFVVVGCVGYRGYFDEAAAEALGAELRAEGWDVAVYPVPAYSTLGALPGSWFADPLLNTFIRQPDGELARLIFHELAHQVAFAKGDTLFNESFATAVERIGATRWLATHADAAALAADARRDQRRADFRRLVMRYRGELEVLYASPASEADKRAGKARVLQAMRDDYAELKRTRWDGYAGYDRWFEHANNASIGVLSAYNDAAPAFERLFEREGRDFARFYAEVRRLAAASRAERRAALGIDDAAAPGGKDEPR
ncbi:aminopeptidase [Piscinibacter koreensis]|uniref:Aminopeptidase n=1 Tax=Piscinibacter koreensis TaxID=2742824 RepID=A0A7Y6NNW2_9BURK|nr:aminopeptidase [Schlegelella koreensis]NUZ06646.1 aminopeptidase [Schlegelella koreensis]